MALIDIFKNKENIDRSHGLKKIIKYLENTKINSVLDLFAGDGSFNSWLLYQINPKLPEVTHIELDKELHSKLHTRFGRHRNNCVNTDAYKFIKNSNKKYDLVFCDNGMWHNEYFSVLPNLKNVLNKGIFIHNINCRPYNKFSNDSEWGVARSDFYEMVDTSNCDPEDLLEKTGQKLKDNGFKIKYGTLFPRELYNGHIYLYFGLWHLQ